MTFNMDIGTFIVACVGSCIAWYQLSKINKQIKIAVDNQRLDKLKIVLEIETQMNQRKLEFDKVSKQIRESALDNNLSEEKKEILQDYFDSIKESYFNSLDRLCYCIDKGYIDDKDWRSEYRNLILEVIKSYESDFGVASPYNNIKNINEKWQQS